MLMMVTVLREGAIVFRNADSKYPLGRQGDLDPLL